MAHCTHLKVIRQKSTRYQGEAKQCLSDSGSTSRKSRNAVLKIQKASLVAAKFLFLLLLNLSLQLLNLIFSDWAINFFLLYQTTDGCYLVLALWRLFWLCISTPVLHTPKIRHFGIKGVSYSKLCARGWNTSGTQNSLQTDSPFRQTAPLEGTSWAGKKAAPTGSFLQRLLGQQGLLIKTSLSFQPQVTCVGMVST